MDNKKNILFISNGYGLSPVLSGGEVRLHAIIKRAPSGFNVSLLASEGGIMAAKAAGIQNSAALIKARSSFIFKREYTGLQRLLGYFISALTGYAAIRQSAYDAVYTSSDAICDIFPAFMYKGKSPRALWCAMLHHKYMNPFKRPGNKLINLILYSLQDLGFRLTAKRADIAFVLNTPEGEAIASLLVKYGFKGTVQKVFNGINPPEKSGIKKDRNLALYIGGLRASKGLYDIVPAWKQACLNAPYKLRVIGSGSARDNKWLLKSVEENGLASSVKLLGFVSGQNLRKELMKASVFFFPSREEGWGISVVDAIACGLRPVAYRLPAYRHFRSKMLEAPCFDTDALGRLTKKAFRLGPLKYDKKFISRFSWDTIAQKEYKIISGALKCLK